MANKPGTKKFEVELTQGGAKALDAMLKMARNYSADMVEGVTIDNAREVDSFMQAVGYFAETGEYNV